MSGPGWAPQPVPPLRTPSGTVVNVSTVSELQAAVRNLQSNTTVMIQPGTYQLTETLVVTGGLTNVAIRGATDNRGDVTLVGKGMSNSQYGQVPHGISIFNAQDM